MSDERIPPRAEQYIRDYLGWEQRRLQSAIQRVDRYIDAYLAGVRFMRVARKPVDPDPGCSRDYIPGFAVPLSKITKGN